MSWFNASRRVDAAQESMNAPYVFADGDSTAHEVKQTLLDLLGQFEVAAAADLAIQFVENVDGESPFNQHLTEWPQEGRCRRRLRIGMGMIQTRYHARSSRSYFKRG